MPDHQEINLEDFTEESKPIIYLLEETIAIEAKVSVAFIFGKL